MLAQIPRKPVFPEHMVAKLRRQIELDVEQDVIPVSAGIYSEHKLMEKLQAIPKPLIVNYDDPVFYELADTQKYPCKLSKCPLCDEQYGLKKNLAVQCHFCAVWNCSQCISVRKRYHPRAKESNSERFTICHGCDDKFLSLQLHHGYVESKALLEEVMRRVRVEKDEIQSECQKREGDTGRVEELKGRNKFKISACRKEQVDLRKQITRMRTQTEDERLRLGVRQKYLKMLLAKKEKMEARVEVKPMSESTTGKEDSPRERVRSIRQLSTTNVLSEVINAESGSVRQNGASVVDSFTEKEQAVIVQRGQKQTAPNDGDTFNFYNYAQWKSGQKELATQKVDDGSYNKNVELSEKQQQNVQQEMGQQPSEQRFQGNQQKKPKQSEVEAADLPTPLDFGANHFDQAESTESPRQLSTKKDYLAQLFSKKPKLIEMQQDELSEPESLKQQVINARKAQLMRSAIETSRRERMQLEMPAADRRTCACNIY